ncbi:MAG TPA: FmdB family zinc ribbon protein, partial [Vicinamibacteria bacterium]
MPLYEYECPDHGRFELVRKFSDPPVTKCPKCGKAVQKMLSAPAIQFKGTGWYVTDYAK